MIPTTRAIMRQLAAGWMVFTIAMGMAHAQVCSESGSGTANCDMSYRNTVVKCGFQFGFNGPSLYPSCPSQPMPMKDTDRKSFIKDFTPYLYVSPEDPQNADLPYSGPLIRGTVGDPTSAFQMIGNAPTGMTLRKNCVNQIVMPGTSSSYEDKAKVIRLQLDNCTNQYILQTALYPYQKENSMQICPTLADPAARCKLTDICQPLRTQMDSKQEYVASDYLKAAWKKMLQDPTYRKTPGAAKEPHLPDRVKLRTRIDPPSPFPEVRLNSIASVPFEEINDPTHPFSPRWDFVDNERDKYSPLTAAYSGDPVFCAGNKTDKIYKVDILTFREERLKFGKKVKQRIDFNKNCLANTGLQKNPCCQVIPNSPYPNTWKCVLKPCATCYGITAQKPACATDYTFKPDRAKVKLRYLPVHPGLRVAGAVQSLNGMSLSNLSSTLSVSNVATLLKSQSALLSALPLNMSLSQALPLLTGQLNLMTLLPPGMDLSQFGSMLSNPKLLLEQFAPNLPFDQIQSLMKGQVDILKSLQQALPIDKALSSLTSFNSLIGQLDPARALGQVETMLKGQMDMLKALPAGLSIEQATGLYNKHIAQLAGLPTTMKVQDAIAELSRTVDGAKNAADTLAALSKLSPDAVLGDVNAMFNSQIKGMMQFGMNEAVSGFTNAFEQQLAGVLKLPPGISIGDVGKMVGSLHSTLGNMNGDTILRNVSGALGGQIDNLIKLPGGFKVSEIKGLVESQMGFLKGLPNGFSMAQAKDLLSGQLGMLSGLSGGLPISQISDIMNGQLGLLNGLNGALPLGSISGLIDTNMFGINALGNIPGLSSLSGVPGFSGLSNLSGASGMSSLSNFSSSTNTLPYLVVKLMYFPRTAKCTPSEFGGANSTKMNSLCRDLREPYVGLNKLKMRYHNPGGSAADGGGPDTVVLKEGVQEGMLFKEYFGDHMPYPRLWDTGRSIQRTNDTGQNPMDTFGQYTAIVGVGREAATDPVNNGKPEKEKRYDERCLYGGWGGGVGESTSFGGTSINLPDPVTSWTELKLYQTRTARELNISCIGRYEKAFKHRSAENQILVASGGEQTSIMRTKCDRQPDGKLVNCVTEEYPEFKDETPPAPGTPADPAIWKSLQYQDQAIPLSWRGYLSAKKDSERFPNFPGGSAPTIKGLDNARCGDIILMPKGADGAKPGLPKLARVSAVNLPKRRSCSSNEPSDCVQLKNCYVEVEEADNGKWPDVCGTTDMFGELKKRKLFKPGMLEKAAREEADFIGWTTSCEDTRLSSCEMEKWKDLYLYRPVRDRRAACDKENVEDCDV